MRGKSYIFTSIVSVLLLTYVGLSQNKWSFDVTGEKRHTLSKVTPHLLTSLPGPVQIRVYIAQFHTDGRKRDDALNTRATINRFFERYRSFKADIAIENIDHSRDITAAQRQGVQSTQAVVVTYRGRSQQLKILDETSFMHTLLQLAYNREPWVVFLEGHGEKSPFRELSTLAIALKQRQVHVQALDLARSNEVPHNTSLLVIAGVKSALKPEEIAALLRYINRGGNLLWLQDPGTQDSLSLIASRIGIEFLPGLVLASKSDKHDEEIIVAQHYTPDHLLTHNIKNLRTLFPITSAITSREVGFTRHDLIMSDKTSWHKRRLTTATKPYTLDLVAGDQKGPMSLAIALEQKHSPQTTQRIITVGDSDFLSDQLIHYGANHTLAMNMFSWLTHMDELIPMNQPRQLALALDFSKNQIFVLGAFFSAGLPLIFIGIAFWVQRRRLQ